MNKSNMLAGVLTNFFFLTSAFAADPIASVRAARADSNAAMAAHDAVRLRQTMHDDYNMFRGNSGNLWGGADAAARGFTDNAFNDPTFVTYQRSPDRITLASSGKRVAESGKWVGSWHMSNGIARLSGIYLAMWTPKDGQWRLKSEAFVTLSCEGSDADCKTLD
jgi:ketosteroid isomerase-like protein